jgi:hypothetical protein
VDTYFVLFSLSNIVVSRSNRLGLFLTLKPDLTLAIAAGILDPGT